MAPSKKKSNGVKERIEEKKMIDPPQTKDKSAGVGAPLPQLYPCVPKKWLWMPESIRWILGWLTILSFTLTFLVPAYPIFLLFPIMWTSPWLFKINMGIICLIVISMLLPMREWPAWRSIGQLWFDIFQFSTNLSPEECTKAINVGREKQLILAMHPHGIVPYQAILWAAYCEEYLTDWTTGDHLFGFGAAADAVCYIPFLRQWMGWLSAGSAQYSVLKKGLMKGEHTIVNSSGRRPRNLFVLPGGVAEVFTSTPGKNVIVFAGRRGLTRLSIETGAEIIPVYVFGGTDFFNNLATSGGWLSAISRKFQMGMTLFWGPYFFAPYVPYTPRVTQVLGEPIPIPPGYSGEGPVPEHLVNELHATYLREIQTLFDTYKEAAGYKDAVLEVR